jgi:drug/metabolite transporter (DMT)-like permease
VGVWIFGETLEPHVVAGAAIVVAAGLFTLWREAVSRRRARPSAPPA